MAQLPDELERLKSRYDQLVADANKGLISRDDAYRLLTQLTVIDAAGAQWGLTDEGRFTCRRNPAEPAEVANPAAFAPASMPMTERTATPSPVFSGREAAMPTDGSTQAPRKSVKDRLAARSERRANAEPPQSTPPPFAEPETPAQGRLASPFERHTTDQRQKRLAPAMKAVLAQPGPIAVAALVAVSLLTSVVTRGGGPKPSAATTTTLPAAASGIGSSVAPTVGPAQIDVQRVVLALGSGPQAALGVITPGAVEPVAVAMASGEWASNAGAGLIVSPEPAVQGAGVFQQRWSLADAAGNPAAAYSVTWVQQSGVWMLTTLPVKL